MTPPGTRLDLFPAAFAWKRARWLRREPGLPYLAVLVAAPVLFLILPPSLAGGLGWERLTTVVLVLGTMVVAAALGREGISPTPPHVWLHQKGVSLGDYALIQYALDAALGFLIVLWWAGVWNVAAVWHGLTPSPWIVLSLGGFFVVAHVTVVVVSAFGSTRGAEVLFLAGLLALLQPLLAGALPVAAGTALHLVLPPLIDASRVRSALVSGAAADALAPLFHIAAYWGVCLGATLLRIERWRPRV